MRKVIVGGGNFGRELAGWFPSDYGEIVFIDDVARQSGLPHRLISTVRDYDPEPGDELILGVSDPAGKRKIFEKLKDCPAPFLNFTHPTAVIGLGARIGMGVVLGPFVSISAGAEVGNFVTINAFSGPGHDTLVGDFATFAAHVNVCGWCHIGTGAYLASSAVVLPHVKVGAGATVGAGAVVARDVAPGATVYAPFARTLRRAKP